MKTLAIIIGISKYEQSIFFKPLQGARTDSAWTNRFLISQGLDKSNIKILLDENATKKNILNAIRQWTLEEGSENLRLLLFYSGHGAVIRELGAPPESVLITYDTEYSDRLGTGISIPELVRAVRRLILQELYIFIDACFMSINSYARAIGELPGLDLFKRVSYNNCFLCMIANNENIAFESKESGLGVFTSYLLEEFTSLSQRKEATILKLVENVQNKQISQNLGKPYIIMAGIVNNWPFNDLKDENIPKMPITILENLHISRIDSVLALADYLRNIAPKPLFLVGKAGIGKTTLLLELSNHLSDTIFVKLEKRKSIHEYLSEILTSILRIKTEVDVPQIILTDTKRSLGFVCDISAQIILILDGFDNIPYSDLVSLIDDLVLLKIQICIPVRETTKIPKVYDTFNCLPFSINETEKLITKLGEYDKQTVKYIQEKTNGIPLLVKQMVLGQSENTIDIMESIDITIAKKIVASNGFIDVDLFCKMMNINAENLSKLERSGFIYKVNQVWMPHDKLIEKVAEREHSNYYQIAIKYWYKEANIRKRSVIPAKKILKLIESLEKHSIDFDNCISDSIQRVRFTGEKINYIDILNLVDNNCELYQKTLTTLAFVFSEIGDFYNVERIFGLLESKQLVNFGVNLAYARACWWKGDYTKCLELSKNVIENSDSLEFISLAYLEAGISNFFTGDWNIAKDYLKYAEESENSIAIVYGWSKLIIGTIDSIRGVSFNDGKRRLEASIAILREEGDLTGLAIAYGNLGESLWKNGNYQESNSYLDKGYSYATMADMLINTVESKRNQLQLEIRWNGPFTAETIELLDYLTKFTIDEIGNMEMMQVANTIATAFLYSNEINKAQKYIEIAHELTIGNNEYHIYTLGNQALLAILSDKTTEAETYILSVIELAKLGDNILGIKQISDDIQYLIKRYGKLTAKNIHMKLINVKFKNI